jgi:hypothetical protein
MTKTFTKNDLIRYLYRETTEKEETEINKALVCDTELLTVYNELCLMKKEIDSAMLEPSSASVLNILSYARSIEQKK